MTTRDVLLKAAERIERDGWAQGGNGRNGKACCAMVAISDAIDEAEAAMHRRLRLFYPAKDALAKAAGIGQQLVSVWNDRPERTAADVIAALRAAAEEQA